MITQKIKVGLSGDLPVPTIQVTQGDHGIGQVSVSVYCQNELVSLGGYAVTFEGVQEDGEAFTVPCTVSGTEAVLTVSEAMTSYSGEFWTAFKLSDNAGTIETDKVKLLVTRSALNPIR